MHEADHVRSYMMLQVHVFPTPDGVGCSSPLRLVLGRLLFPCFIVGVVGGEFLKMLEH